jgi:hypothetical protein
VLVHLAADELAGAAALAAGVFACSTVEEVVAVSAEQGVCPAEAVQGIVTVPALKPVHEIISCSVSAYGDPTRFPTVPGTKWSIGIQDTKPWRQSFSRAMGSL